MKFLVDAQLPPALAGALVEGGHEADHVENAGLRHAKDGPIWNHALAHGQVIITKDEDFASRSLVAARCPQIVWLRIGNSSRRALLTWFIPQLPRIVGALQSGAKLVEIR